MNTAIIMDMMFNTEMIVKDMKGGKEDMTEKRFKPIINGVEDILTGEKLNNQFEVSLKLNSLNDENEQLKQTMQEVAELLSEEVDLFSDKATEHDICAYVELKELDNKDAYYMAISTKKAIKMLKGDVE